MEIQEQRAENGRRKIYILEGNTLKNHDICSKIGDNEKFI